jgi:uncharacterized protein
MSNEKPRGRFVWHELLTADPDAAQKFYSKVMGWGTQVFPGPEPYTMWKAGDNMVGGMMPLPPDAVAPPHWLGYVSTANVDRTADAAQQKGATIMVPPTDIPDVGRFAVLTDPFGAEFAIYQAKEGSAGPGGSPKEGEFSWHELTTSDVTAAFDFYQSLFGWEKTSAMDMGELGVYQMFGVDGDTFGGMFKQPPDMPGPPSWQHYVKVDDVKRVVEVVKADGGQVINGPMEVPGGDWIANCIDPQGAVFALHSPAQVAAV